MTVLPLKAFEDNYIWCIMAENESHCAVVDPGDAVPVLKFLQEHDLVLTDILITHRHFDHTGGVEQLLQYYPAKVFGHAKIPTVTHPVAEKDNLTTNDYNFQVLAIPGHTLDHLAYYENSAIFCGDTLFTAGCGKIFEGTPKQMFESLMKISKLPDDTLIYCGHEYTLNNLKFALMVEPSNEDIQHRMEETKKLRAENKPTVPAPLKLEHKTNPFLRCHKKTVIEAVSDHYKKNFTDTIDVFAHLREWKNHM